MCVYKRKVPLEPGWQTRENLSELANFSASDQLERNFPTVPNCPPKKEKP